MKIYGLRFLFLYQCSSDFPYNEECGSTMVIKAYPLGMVRAMDNVNGEEEGETRVISEQGLECYWEMKISWP